MKTSESDKINDKRFFPLISARLYDTKAGESSNSKIDPDAAKLLAMGNDNLRFWQKYAGLALNAKNKLARILRLHREAIAAETAGYFGRADFFWRELFLQTLKIIENQSLWQELSGEKTPAATLSAADLKHRIIEELFIDTHLAFYKSYFARNEDLTSQNRAFAHSAYLREYISISSLRGDELRNLVCPLVETEARLHGKAGKWEKPVELYRFVLQFFSDSQEYQDKLAEAYFAKAVSSLDNQSSEASAHRDAQTLFNVITPLQKLCAEYRYNINFFRILGHLYHLYAVKLNNSGNFSTALLAIEKALVFYPHLEEAAEAREKLSESMEALQKQFVELEAEFKRANVQFNPGNEKLWRQSKTGFRLVNEYLDSKEPENIRAAFYVAQARQIWKLVNLPEPSGNWDEYALLFVQGLDYVLNEKPETNKQIIQSWEQVTEKIPALANIDRSPVVKFIAARLLENHDAKQPIELPANNAPFPEREAGQIKVSAKAARKKGGEPFGYWLFSRQNLRVKVQAVAALVILLLAGGLYIRESRAASARDEAFRQITEAAQKQQFTQVLDNAEKFLAHRRYIGTDVREEQVENYYSEAIVRFVTQQNSVELDPATIARVDRYRSLTGKTK